MEELVNQQRERDEVRRRQHRGQCNCQLSTAHGLTDVPVRSRDRQRDEEREGEQRQADLEQRRKRRCCGHRARQGRRERDCDENCDD